MTGGLGGGKFAGSGVVDDDYGAVGVTASGKSGDGAERIAHPLVGVDIARCKFVKRVPNDDVWLVLVDGVGDILGVARVIQGNETVFVILDGMDDDGLIEVVPGTIKPGFDGLEVGFKSAIGVLGLDYHPLEVGIVGFEIQEVTP